MKNLKRLFALVMALCLCLSATAFAAEMEDTSGAVGDSAVTWRLDDLGRLFIGGEGEAPIFSAKEDQPWADLRDEIKEVWFDDMEATHIPDLAYWFTDCTALESAEIPYTTRTIGTDAFAGCSSLDTLFFYQLDEHFEIAPGAFHTESYTKTRLLMLPEHPDVLIQVRSYDWREDNRQITIYDVYSPATLMGCGIAGCTCSGDCDGYYAYESNGASGHTRYIRCDGCGKESFITSTQSHSFSGNTCTLCGYTKSGGSSGGGGGTDTCRHTSTYTNWSGCDWYKYCNNCGDLVDWGTAHSAYIYGAWQYYDTAQHYRTKQCGSCWESLGYDYGYHSPTNSYSPYNDAQHKVTSSCSICGTAIGSATYENHSDSNGDGSCDACGYSLSVTVTWDAGSNGGTVNGSNSVTTSVTSGSVATPPSRTPSRLGYTFKGWYTAVSGGSLYSSVTVSSARTFYAQFEANSYTVTWNLGNGNSETTSQEYGAALVLPTEPTKDGYTFDGWFTETEGGTEVTGSTIYTTDSESVYYAHWTRVMVFSATVPVTLPMSVSEDGTVHTANHAIQNNSTGAIAVTGITVTALNGWSLVPMDTDMAAQKVDAKLLGFSLNGAETTARGDTQALSLAGGGWTIPEADALALDYDAVVSAMSKAVTDEAVLSVVFVLEWA